MKFERVKLNKTDTCLTYVLKRIGQYDNNTNYTLDLYDEYFDSEIFEDINKLKRGDIVMWTAKEHIAQYPFEILESGVIITHNILSGRHIAVIEEIVDEKTILYSDCNRRNSEVGIPQINMKNILETRAPDYILTKK